MSLSVSLGSFFKSESRAAIVCIITANGVIGRAGKLSVIGIVSLRRIGGKRSSNGEKSRAPSRLMLTTEKSRRTFMSSEMYLEGCVSVAASVSVIQKCTNSARSSAERDIWKYQRIESLSVRATPAISWKRDYEN